MYVDEQGGAGSGWQVDPDRVRDFAAAVEEVRAHLDVISREVTGMSTPDYAPMLGTSPVGQELAEKFSDRMGSADGLRGHLDTALANVENFVTSAEKTAASYLQMDGDSAQGYRYS